MMVPNGILDEPAVDVEVAPDRWVQADAWPSEDARTQKLALRSDGTMRLGVKDDTTVSYVNAANLSEANAVRIGESPNKLQFFTGVTRSEVRVSGTPTVDLEVTRGRPVGQLSVQLVDYGTMDRVLTTSDGALTLATESCWGESTAVDDACYRDVVRRTGPTDLQILARGWIRLDGEGTQNVTVELQANDVVVPKGHQLGLVISGNRTGVTSIDTSTQTYSINLATSRLNLPIEGPMASFAPGQIKPQKTADLREGTLPELDGFMVPLK